jgi:hypothetical protein
MSLSWERGVLSLTQVLPNVNTHLVNTHNFLKILKPVNLNFEEWWHGII